MGINSGDRYIYIYICHICHIITNFQLAQLSYLENCVSPQHVIQYVSRFELKIGKTLPETIVFKLRKLQLAVYDNMTKFHSSKGQ